jgi:hypothetical protein
MANSEQRRATMITARDMKSRFEELDYRENDGIQISLLWRRTDNSLVVIVVDTKAEETFELSAHADDAMDVFHHPFAYAGSRLVAAELAAPVERLGN